MSAPSRAFLRVQAELQRMNKSPPHGIGMWPIGNNLESLEAVIEGPDDSPFAGGEFRLVIRIPPLYPNQPKHPKQKYRLTEQGKALLQEVLQFRVGMDAL